MSDKVLWVLELTLKDGKQNELKTLATKLIKVAQNEPGTLSYHWSFSADESVCHIIEQYADSQAALDHLATLNATSAEELLSLGDPTGLAVYGSPTDELKEALAGFGPVFYDYYEGFDK